ncbi:hypothetical protein G5I_04757 [Acromyrmex echinatior]|uniref:Uncharacterized protein n=1 Tax=Acromyrmex echinatior TaxID=103372 RepID=F4WGH8_ACREC|nr:hypothetical protein G5I_04757 [Acromyrmex echinatior]
MSQSTYFKCKRFIPCSHKYTFCEGVENALPLSTVAATDVAVTKVIDKIASLESGLDFLDRLEFKLDALVAKINGYEEILNRLRNIENTVKCSAETSSRNVEIASLSERQVALEQRCARLEEILVSDQRDSAIGDIASTDMMSMHFECLMIEQRDNEHHIWSSKDFVGERIETVLLVHRRLRL